MPKRIDLGERRASIAEALWRVVESRGMSGVSVRSVAEEAGIAVGSLRHVFPSRAELLSYSCELMLDRARQRVEAVPVGDSPERTAVEVLQHLLPLTAQSRAEFDVNLALYAEAPAVDGIAEARDRAFRTMAQGCLAVVLALGVDEERAESRARRLHALVDGLALHLTVTGGRSDASDSFGEWARQLLAEEVRSLADEAGRGSGHPGGR